MKVKKLKGIIAFLCIGIVLVVLLYVDRLERYPQVKEVTTEKEVIVEVEKEVVSEVYIEVEPKNHYNITNVEREMIARLLYREAGAASLECQKMVVSVIFNRYDAAEEGTTLSDIVYANEKGKDGIIHISPFTCMPEIMSQNFFPAMRENCEIPILPLIMDEQTGKAGYITRLEAFVDLMRRRKRRKEQQLAAAAK